ncbi:hypothetical protein Dsin_025205 [Dipteronia sinensis]|uniref:Reverse transcriptase domain-containing protein n=1 Tax=Dipteronia sinensis TaxID=43782 RepID=A0AAD9ZV69_9ROSI|nr:hypothetical protein Dsin_025205 [Dipteronia sinensis]
MYKVLVKVLANRLKKVMNLIIEDTQMAFVKNRQIVDSFVIDNEVIHSWMRDKEGGLLIKLDFEKAYDSMELSFLDSVLREMGFGDRLRRWMRDCVSTPTLSILVNGSPIDQFGVERGLCQGDPLSHFMFNIAIEASNCLFKKASDAGANPCTKKFWEPMLQKIGNQLSPCKMRFLTKNRRLVLIKVVLSNIPTYYMSVFKMSKGVAQKIERLQQEFFGAMGLRRGKSTQLIGLRDVRWQWYNSKQDSAFVKAIHKLFENNTSTTSSLMEGLQIVIGRGDRASFWEDIRWDSIPLRVAFPQIFALSSKKVGKILSSKGRGLRVEPHERWNPREGCDEKIRDGCIIESKLHFLQLIF